MSELRSLTGARGIAAWWVVLYHIRLSVAGLPAPVLAVLAKGYLAVDFFFLLSGFVIWLAWHERLGAGRWRMVRAFWWKRIARVWPLHAAMLCVAVALAAVLALGGRADPARFPWAELPAQLLLVQNWGFTDALHWNVPAWSISTEALAYILFPLGVIAIDWRRVPSWAVLAAIAAMLVLLHALFARSGSPSLGYDIASFGLPRCLLEFGVGTALAALWQRWQGRRGVAPGCAVAAAVAGIAWLAGWAPETLCVPAMFAALLLLLALTAGRRHHPLEGRVLHLLGEISYATYLSHFLLFVIFKLAMVSDASDVPPPLVALYLAVVLAASLALYELVERPAQRWLQALPVRRGRTPAPARA